MSAPPTTNADARPVENRDELVAFLESGSKPKSDWRIGTEHEKFGYRIGDFSPMPYDNAPGETGATVKAMLEGMQRFGWEPAYEGDNVIALLGNEKTRGGSITLEPGGQFELSGAPLETLHQTCDEVHTHLAQVAEIAGEIDAGFIGLGFAPRRTLEDTPVMPKGRYKIMRAYMSKVGTRGLDMMFRTATVQVNLDFGSEADMIEKYRIALALQPLATAIFANSPFKEGKPNGVLSNRAHVWLDTDRDRTGMLPFAFEDGFGFEQYTDYALDVPMYFVYRGGDYVDVSGQSFRDFMEGRLKGLEGERPTLDDWESHLTTIFPEARLKRFIEMRGADGGPWRRLCALPAFWVGLLYDDAAQKAAWDLVKDWTAEEREALHQAVPAQALNTPFRNGTLLDIARDALAIAQDGLKARARTDSIGADERGFLAAIEATLAEGRTPAEELLDNYNGKWAGNLDRLFEDYSY
ncbi:glutamate--cysteine ligase [Pyruvatibacter mobilis]|uniref:glutamate--cysteine ligase n=1 Tax=Pyruvatibacter mobilis TaxID=1712261 RepID=UPI003BA8DDF7